MTAYGRPRLATIAIARPIRCLITRVWVGSIRDKEGSRLERLPAILYRFVDCSVVNKELDIQLPRDGRPSCHSGDLESMLFTRREGEGISFEIVVEVSRVI